MKDFTNKKFISWKLLKHSSSSPRVCPMSATLISPHVNSAHTSKEQAKVLLKQIYFDKTQSSDLSSRLKVLETQQNYNPLPAEIEFASRIAWRNATRCIGRLFWSGLQVRDKRHIDDSDTIFHEVKEHIKIATNKGKIKSVITIFAPLSKKPDLIISPQLIRYAGYRDKNDQVLGDPQNSELTQLAIDNGWSSEKTEFDILPLIIKNTLGEYKVYDYSNNTIMEVDIKHPSLKKFNNLNLKWYVLPAISNMFLDAFGELYPVVFNGWYMGTEIGGRNLSDPYRYNKLPIIAQSMGLDIYDESTMWRDKALIELNYAVLNSFKHANVTIIDHHNASREFLEFVADERAAGREVNANWSWTVPPISGSLSPQFHLDFKDEELRPAFVYNDLNVI